MIGDPEVMAAWGELVLKVRDPLISFLDSLNASERVTVAPIASSLAYGVFGRYIVEASQSMQEGDTEIEAHMKGMFSVLEDERVQSLIQMVQSSSPVLSGFANPPRIGGGDTDE